jgi:hypothetical protein
MKEQMDSLSTFPTEATGAVPMQSPAQETAAIEDKSLPLAIGLNLLLPGAGSIYLGRVMLGIVALLIVSLIVLGSGLLWFVATWLVVNMIMAIDMWILFIKNEAALEAAGTRRCPYCAELIQKEASVCKHCHCAVPVVGVLS